MRRKPLIERTLTFDPADMARRGRVGAYRLHATHDVYKTTAKGREVFLRRFEDEVDPHRELPEAERRRRAEAAKRAYFTKLAYKSAKARQARREGAAG
jgi:DNA-binding PadR family transcriptional regulator